MVNGLLQQDMVQSSSISMENAEIRVQLKNPALPLLLLLLLVVQATNPARIWQYMLTGMVLANGVAVYWIWQTKQRLVAERQLVWSWVQVGDLLEERFTLANHSWLPLLWAEIVDHSTVPNYPVARVESVPGRSARSWHVRGVCRMRGHYTLGPWELRVGEPFGILQVVFHFKNTEEIIVFPPIVKLSEVTLALGAATGASRTRSRAREMTIDVRGVRSYIPGDSLTRIHWPTTARRQGLHVKEFDFERSGSLWIILDLDSSVQAGSGEQSTAEYGVVIAASIAHMLLSDNRPVGLYSHGQVRAVIPPNVGLSQLWNLMHTLTLIQPGEGASLAEAIEDWSRTLSRDTTLAVITPSSDDAWLEPLARVLARGIPASVTLLDAESFTEGESGHLPALVAALADLGVQTRIIQAGMRFEHLVPLAHRGIRQFRTGATGRAIPVAQPDGAEAA